MNNNRKALDRLIKQASKSQEKDKEKEKQKPKARKYTVKQFENRVGVKPMTVVFNKRTDGTTRTMNFIRDWDMLNDKANEFGYKPGKGLQQRDYAKNNLSLVWDLDKNAYRSVNLNAIQKLKNYIM